MRVMQVMFPTTCEKCQRQKIYMGRNIARVTRITRKPDHAQRVLGSGRRAGDSSHVFFLGYNRLIYATTLPTSVTTELGCV